MSFLACPAHRGEGCSELVALNADTAEQGDTAQRRVKLGVRKTEDQRLVQKTPRLWPWGWENKPGVLYTFRRKVTQD